MKKLIYIIVLLPILCFAQKQGNIWYFGYGAGLDFNSGSPVVIQGGQFYSCEGPASISDSSGMLLFYSDGEKLWNRLHQVMPNGDSLLGHRSASQAAFIVPMPGTNHFYYVFTNDAFVNDFQNGLNYSIVDICNENGLGDVVKPKNIHLLDTASEKFAVTRHSNGIDYWLVTVKHFTNSYYAYPITYLEVGTPVVSNVGSSHQGGYYSALGQAKISPDGTKLIVNAAQTPSRFVELFDFDNSTGIISNTRSIIFDGNHMFGASFSPNSCMLYISENAPLQINQYDVCAGGGHIDSINASRKIIPVPFGSTSGLQIGPDDKIYCKSGYSNYLSTINFPDSTYPACNYIHQAIFFNTIEVGYGGPNFIANYDYTNTYNNCIYTNLNKYCNEKLSIFPNPTTGPIIINNEELIIKNVAVYDIYGKEVLKQEVKDQKYVIDLSTQPKGIYIIKATTSKGVAVEKVVKN